MSKRKIIEISNPISLNRTGMKEVMDVFVPNIKNENISRRNGMIYTLVGAGGSGKTDLLNNMMNDDQFYRRKFSSIYLFIPECSFASITNHPFKNHDKVYHELTVERLETIYQKSMQMKRDATKKKGPKLMLESGDVMDDEKAAQIQYSCILIDDFANELKNPHIQAQLEKMMIKSRHICCSFIFSLQSFLLFPKILRKQITYATTYSCQEEEWADVCKLLPIKNRAVQEQIFQYCFSEPYSHLDIDVRESRMYKNFNKLEIEK